MKQGDEIHLEKGAALPARPESIENGYWVKGFLLFDIEIGKPICIARYANSKNNEDVPGFFRSSAVKSIEGSIVSTENSKYIVKILKTL